MSATKSDHYMYGTCTTPTTQFDQGPWVVGAIDKVVGALVRGSLSYDIATESTSTTIVEPIMWGLQWVHHGAASLDIVSSVDGLQWLFREHLVPSGWKAVWAPSTDTAAVAVDLPLKQDWYGQLPVNDTVDFYLSFGNAYALSADNYIINATAQLYLV
jgi:hypothetical protein